MLLLLVVVAVVLFKSKIRIEHLRPIPSLLRVSTSYAPVVIIEGLHRLLYLSSLLRVSTSYCTCLLCNKHSTCKVREPPSDNGTDFHTVRYLVNNTLGLCKVWSSIRRQAHIAAGTAMSLHVQPYALVRDEDKKMHVDESFTQEGQGGTE